MLHLHVQSEMSLMRSSLKVGQIPELAKSLGAEAVALTDECNLFGAIQFDKACKEHGVRPIFGAVLNVQPEGVQHEDPLGKMGGYKLIALVKNEIGWRNLCRMVTGSIFEGMWYKPRVDLEILSELSYGLMFVTHGLWSPERSVAWQDAGEDEARKRLHDLVQAVGQDSLVMSLCDVGVLEEPNDLTRKLAAEFGLRLCVTNAVCQATMYDAVKVDLLNSIGDGARMDAEDRLRLQTDQMYMKTAEELRELFPDDSDAFETNRWIADQCQFEFEYGKYRFPNVRPPTEEASVENWQYLYEMFPPPKSWGMPDEPPPVKAGCTTDQYFAWYARTGLKRRLGKSLTTEYVERLESEIAVIQKMGFSVYLLVVSEFIAWAKDRGIDVGPGRGSGAGSLVLWAMLITEIDPLPYGLFFERFLNPERVSMPDIDVDFCKARREEVIAHVREKYGDEYVVQIVTHGSLKAKAALRAVGRTLGMGPQAVNELSKLVPDKPVDMSLSDALQAEPKLRARMGDPLIRRVVELALSVENAPSSLGVHAAGVIIADRPVIEHMPLYRAGPDDPVVGHFDMGSSEAIGLIKFDFLGLKTLDQLRLAVQMIAQGGEEIVLEQIPLDDEPTYKMLQKADTQGVFQLESGGMRNLIADLVPTEIEDLIALVALYRPGPLQAGMVDEYVDRKHGREPIEVKHKALEEVLAPTYGTLVYQEQVMRVAQVMAGYSGAEADLLRRAMGKKKEKAMDEQRARFVDGAQTQGYSKEDAEEMFDLMAVFAGYAFNKAHSAAYGMLAYWTAYLKANHRPEFMAAVMTIEVSNQAKVAKYVADLKRYGVEVRLPCVNESEAKFTVEDGAVRFALSGMKGVGEGAAETVVESRQKLGRPFGGMVEFLAVSNGRRVTKKVIQVLAKSGAFDCFGVDRRVIVEQADDLVALRRKIKKQMGSRSPSENLMEEIRNAFEPQLKWRKLKPWSLMEMLTAEEEALGLYVSDHPMSRMKYEMSKFASGTLDGLENAEDGALVVVAAMVSSLRKHRAKTGWMAFAKFDDGTGEAEGVVFPSTWKAASELMQSKEPLLMKCKVQWRSGQPQLIVDKVKLFRDHCMRNARKLFVKCSEEELELLDQMLLEGGGRVPLSRVEDGKSYPTVYRVRPSVKLEKMIENALGKHGVVAVG